MDTWNKFVIGVFVFIIIAFVVASIIGTKTQCYSFFNFAKDLATNSNVSVGCT